VPSWQSNPRPLDRKSDILPTGPRCHLKYWARFDFLSIRDCRTQFQHELVTLRAREHSQTISWAVELSCAVFWPTLPTEWTAADIRQHCHHLCVLKTIVSNEKRTPMSRPMSTSVNTTPAAVTTHTAYTHITSSLLTCLSSQAFNPQHTLLNTRWTHLPMTENVSLISQLTTRFTEQLKDNDELAKKSLTTVCFNLTWFNALVTTAESLDNCSPY